MKKSTKKVLEETKKLALRNRELHKQLQQHMQKAKDTIESISTGSIDALVMSDKKNLKVYTERSADRIYRILIEKMHEGAVTINKEGIILYCNSSFADMVNQPLQKVIGGHFENFIEDSSKEHFRDLEKKSWKSYISDEIRIIDIAGKIIPALLSMTTLQTDNEIVLSIILSDLTNRKKNEANIRYLAAIVESSDDAIITKSLDGTIQSWNKGAEKLFGYKAKEAIGKNISLIIPKEYANQEKEIIERIRRNEISHYETERKTKNGKQFYVSITISPLKDEAGNIIGASKIARDITSRKKAEDELIKANKELVIQNTEKEKRSAELIIANKELAFQNAEKEKRADELTIVNKDLTTFTHLTSHDLQEPLRKIQNFVSLVIGEEAKKLSDDGKKYLQGTYDTAKQMQELLEDLLTYSQILKAEKNFEKTDLTMIVDEVKNSYEIVIKEKQLTIEVEHLCEANIIRLQFRQLFQNLISNSLKFSKPGTPPHIVIKSEIIQGNKVNNEGLSPKSDYCHITYTDNGIGFDPKYKDQIFEIFQRLHSKEEYEGNGAGLAICKMIVENHKGVINAIGELSKGAQFNIYIPVG